MSSNRVSLPLTLIHVGICNLLTKLWRLRLLLDMCLMENLMINRRANSLSLKILRTTDVTMVLNLVATSCRNYMNVCNLNLKQLALQTMVTACLILARRVRCMIHWTLGGLILEQGTQWRIVACSSDVPFVVSRHESSDRQLAVMVAARRLGAKKSKISMPWDAPFMKMPWEVKPLCTVFENSKSFPPVPVEAIHVAANSQAEVPGMREVSRSGVKWAAVKRRVVDSWPIALGKEMHQSLELWRVIAFSGMHGTRLGRILCQLSGADDADAKIAQTLKDTFCNKASSTLRSRAFSLISFSKWKASRFGPDSANIFPIQEQEVYDYICDLRTEGAPVTRARRLFEAVAFAKGLLGADVDDILKSPRIQGAVKSFTRGLVPRKKLPLPVHVVAAMEGLVVHGDSQTAILVGYFCFWYMRD